MPTFRELQEKLQQIEESYYSRLATAIDELVVANPRLTPVQLVGKARIELGDEAAKYLSDKLETEGDFLDYDSRAPAAKNPVRKHMKGHRKLGEADESVVYVDTQDYEMEGYSDRGLPHVWTDNDKEMDEPNDASVGAIVNIQGGEYDGKKAKVLDVSGGNQKDGIWTNTFKLHLLDIDTNIDDFMLQNPFESIVDISVSEDAMDHMGEDDEYCNTCWGWDEDDQQVCPDCYGRNAAPGHLARGETGLEEARGTTVEVPEGLRGDGRTWYVRGLTSKDAENFIREIGIDDQVSHDVVDPETGELLFQAGTTKRQEIKKGNHQKLNHADFTRGAKLREPESPIFHAGWDNEDYEAKMDKASETLDELRDSDFYNVVWKEMSDLVDDPDDMADKDYDVSMVVPIAIKRKDGKRFEEEDHDNFREIVKAVKNMSTMGNTGIVYAGTTNNGTVARFTPSFF